MRVPFFAQLLPVPLDPLFVAAGEVLPKPMRLLREAHLVAGLLFEQHAARQMIFSLPTGRPLAVTHLYTAASI